METIWFIVIAVMLTAYVVLDGFDLGAGMLHLSVAKTDVERRTVLGAIGPVWDGNEVWLIASGGIFVFAFPAAYASAFSGLYLPLMMVLWLLILRGVSIEFRSKLDNPLWRGFWDSTFALASGALAIIFGVALGNLIRGLPLDSSGSFRMTLFEDFRTGLNPGALDWYTISVGAFAGLILAAHGGLYLRWKTGGSVGERCARTSRILWWWVAALGVLLTPATYWIQPDLFARLGARPWAWPLAAAPLVAWGFTSSSIRRDRELKAFLGCAATIASLLALTAAVLFPDILRSTLGSSNNLTVLNSASGRSGLTVGLIWWGFALLLALGYFIYVFRSFQGKIHEGSGHY